MTSTDATETEAARIERELLAALHSSRATHPDLNDAPERLGLLAALRIVQGDRFGAPHVATEGGVQR
jgi:hypothetical protein